MFIEILKAALYGILEGITEWLPVSSTGHMILFEEILPMKVSENFWNVFLVVIQLGAILAVVLLYWNKIFPFNFKNKNRPFIRYDIMNFWLLVSRLPSLVSHLMTSWRNICIHQWSLRQCWCWWVLPFLLLKIVTVINGQE